MKNLELIIYTKEDFTDGSILEYLSTNNEGTVKEYSEFLLSRTLYNRLAENIIRFISTYDSGFFKPEKCNAYEPVNKKFNEKELSGPISWLSQPGGAFYFKKDKIINIEGCIENRRFAPVWEGEDGVQPLKPKVEEPVFKGEVKMFITTKVVSLKGVDYLLLFIKELCRIVNASAGLLSIMGETEELENKVIEGDILITEGAREFFYADSIPIK